MDNLISAKAKIGKNVKIGFGVRIYDNVEIGDDTIIGDLCIIGLPSALGKNVGVPLYIGVGSIIRSHTVLYEGSYFKSKLETGHHVVARDGVKAGDNFRIGSYSSIEGENNIGDYVRIHGHVQLGRNVVLGSFVWIFAHLLTLDDPLPPSHVSLPSRVEDGVVICVKAMLYPGITIGKAAFVSACATVKENVPPCAVVTSEGRIGGRVDLLIHRESGLRHPWYNHFADAYPPEAQPRLKELLEFVKHNARTK